MQAKNLCLINVQPKVPGPLTAEIESKKTEKKKAQRAQRKQREKEQKEDIRKQELEAEEKKRFASLTDREKVSKCLMDWWLLKKKKKKSIL